MADPKNLHKAKNRRKHFRGKIGRAISNLVAVLVSDLWAMAGQNGTVLSLSERERERERERETDRDRERDRGRQKDRHTDIQTETETETERERDRERERERERESQTHRVVNLQEKLIIVTDHSWTSGGIFRVSYLSIPEIFMKLLANGALLCYGLSLVGHVSRLPLAPFI